jgi:hypothetical protein
MMAKFKKKFYVCKELPKTSKAQDVFNFLFSYPERKHLSWENCVGICTDGVPSVVGAIRDFRLSCKKKF